MPNIDQKTRPDIASANFRANLPDRVEPYWLLLSYSRHLGYQKRKGHPGYWAARIRTKDGQYNRRRLGLADGADAGVLTHAEAVAAAEVWFREAEVRHRFLSLDRENADLAKSEADALQHLRASLHGPDWRSYVKIAAAGAWPRSNFYRGDPELVLLCQGKGLGA